MGRHVKRIVRLAGAETFRNLQIQFGFSFLPEHLVSDTTSRMAAYPIEPMFRARWSSWAFEGACISDDELFTLFEAARWAPASFNHQPWRFIYAHREEPARERFVGLMMPFNVAWAWHASVLVFTLSYTLIQLLGSDGVRLSHSHSFDAGAAWAFLTLQANQKDHADDGKTGVDFERARSERVIPGPFRIEAVIAVGRRGEKSRHPEASQGRESPSTRRPLEELAAPGPFTAALAR